MLLYITVLQVVDIFVFALVSDVILAVLVLHGVVDVPPALKRKLVSKLWSPVPPLHHRFHLGQKTNSNAEEEKKKNAPTANVKI